MQKSSKETKEYRFISMKFSSGEPQERSGHPPRGRNKSKSRFKIANFHCVSPPLRGYYQFLTSLLPDNKFDQALSELGDMIMSPRYAEMEGGRDGIRAETMKENPLFCGSVAVYPVPLPMLAVHTPLSPRLLSNKFG